MSLNQDLDPLTLRKVFAQHPSGVAALCTVLDGEKTGLVASSFTVGVSLEPALVMFAVQKTSNTWPKLRTADRIGVSVLSERNDGVCGQIASKHGDRFAGVETHEIRGLQPFFQKLVACVRTVTRMRQNGISHASERYLACVRTVRCGRTRCVQVLIQGHKS